MTRVYNDNVDVTLTIDEDPWHVIDAKVELSRMSTPNYVDLLMVPDPNQTAPNLPNKINSLLGADFRLEADNQLISERDTDAEEDSLLFDGNLANISPTGERTYEGIAYDPAQQPFTPSEGGGGSIMNQYIDISIPGYSYADKMWESYGAGVSFEPQTFKASELIVRALDKMNIEDYEIELKKDGVTVEGDEGSYTGGYDRKINITQSRVKISDLFARLREKTESEWWFDKEGTFHFGVPRPTKHELRFITDTDAGKTTPPYQSIRVIGSGSASQEGYSRTNMDIENKIIVEKNLALSGEGDPTIEDLSDDEEPKEPVFEYRNLEVSTDEQAEATAKKVAEDLGEQQEDGTITVVGFPEVVPLDGVLMPNTEEQPMGGRGYNVYKVVHRLNNSDGFITKIHVAGVIGVTKTVVSNDPDPDIFANVTQRERELFAGSGSLE